MGPGLWVGHWDAEAGHIAMPRVVWSSLATSWAKLGINHPVCPSPAVPPLPSSVPEQQPASPAFPAAWGQPVLTHGGSFTWGDAQPWMVPGAPS